MIAKFSFSNPEMRQRPNTKTSYEQEVRFYQKVAKRVFCQSQHATTPMLIQRQVGMYSC